MSSRKQTFLDQLRHSSCESGIIETISDINQVFTS